MTEASIAAQRELVPKIVNFIRNAKQKKSSKVQTIPYFQSRIEFLESYWEIFIGGYYRLAALAHKYKNDPYFASDYYSVAKDAYLDAKSELMEDILKLQEAGSSASADDPPSPMLTPIERSAPPTVSMRSFDGSEENWESFKDRFLAFIESHLGLSNVSKLQHLLDAMRDLRE